MELLVSKDMYGIPIPLMIRNDSLSFKYENFIRVYHVYIKVWSRILGECLLVKKEPSNGVDKNTVAVIPLHSGGREEVVGHKPQNISKVVRFHCISLSLTKLCRNFNSVTTFTVHTFSSDFKFQVKMWQRERERDWGTKIGGQLKDSVNYYLK